MLSWSKASDRHTQFVLEKSHSIFPVFQGIFLANVDEDAAFLLVAIKVTRGKFSRGLSVNFIFFNISLVYFHKSHPELKGFLEREMRGRSLKAIYFPSEIPLSSLENSQILY